MSIIAVSGTINSGKDTVAKMIQCFLSGEDNWPNKPISRFSERGWEFLSGWEIKKFSYKLKQTASLLTGIPVEDFEKQEVKDSYLPECWNKWTVRYMGYVERVVHYFSDYNSAEEHYEHLIGKGVFNLQSPTLESITVRQFLQWLGTEAVRDNLHPNTWVNALMVEYKPTNNCIRHSDGLFYTDEHGLNKVSPIYPKWIITDTRFKNELQAVKDRGGICVRVDRKSIERGSTHPSETEWRDWEFDHVFDNNGTLEELYEQVKEFLTKYNIE